MVCSKNIVTTTNELFCCQGIERSLILRFALIRIFVTLLAWKRNIRRGISRNFQRSKFPIIATVTFSLFPRFKNQFLREWNRWTMNIVCRILPRLFSRYSHLPVSCSPSRLFRAEPILPRALFNSYFRVWTVSLLSLPVMPYADIVQFHRPIRNLEILHSSFPPLSTRYNCRHLY